MLRDEFSNIMSLCLLIQWKVSVKIPEYMAETICRMSCRQSLGKDNGNNAKQDTEAMSTSCKIVLNWQRLVEPSGSRSAPSMSAIVCRAFFCQAKVANSVQAPSTPNPAGITLFGAQVEMLSDDGFDWFIRISSRALYINRPSLTQSIVTDRDYSTCQLALITERWSRLTARLSFRTAALCSLNLEWRGILQT